MRTIEQLLADLKRIQRGGGDTEDVDAELAQHGYVNKDAHRGGSRFVGEGASPDLVKHVAAGGSVGPGGEFTSAGAPAGTIGAKADGGSLADTMTKALSEGTPSAGGVLVPAEVAAQIVTLI